VSYAGIDITSKCPPIPFGAFDPWAGLSTSARGAIGPLIAATVWGGLAYALAPKPKKVVWGLGAALGTSLFVGMYMGHLAGGCVPTQGPSS
jgi:hypothetical protein